MLFAIGAASSAIDLLKSLTSSAKSASSQATNFSATTSASSDTSATASVATASPPKGNVAPETMSALLDAQSQSGAASSTTATKSQSKALKDLFNLIDGNGDGSITKSEFEEALGAGGTNVANADSVFSKMDKDGDGSVSVDEMAAALQSGKSKHAHRAKPPGAEQTDPLLKALDEANTASSESRKANASYLSINQMVQQQAQIAASASGSSLSVSA